MPPAAAVPIIVKIPVPTTAPMPKIKRSKTFKVLFSAVVLLSSIKASVDFFFNKFFINPSGSLIVLSP